MAAYNRSVVPDLIAKYLARGGHGAQTRLAEACGVAEQTVSKWKDGQVVPRPERWPTIESTLGMDDGEIAREAGYEGPQLDDIASRISRLETQVAEIVEMLDPDRNGDAP